MGNTYNPQTGKIDRVVSKLPDEKIIIDHVTGATCKTLEDYINKVGSAGIVAWENGGVTDVGSATIDIDAGSALFRTSNDHDSPLVFGDWAARTGVSLTDNSDNYIIAEYNAGSPQVIVSTSNTANYHDKILLATVYKDGTGTGAILHINQYFKQDINDAVAHIIQRFIQQAGFSRESGALLSGSNLNIAITQGVFWLGLNRFLTNAFDSSVSDTFTYFWRDGSGGWTHLNGQSQINATRYDDGTGGSLLPNGVLGTNRYGVHWVYLETDSEVAIVYGRGNYLIKDAEAAEPPSDLPPEFGANHGIFIGKIIVQEGATTLHSVESSFTVTFSGSSGVTSHLDLTDIGVNTHPQIDSHIADSTIHYTQASISITESQISDLQDYLLVDGTRAMTGNLDMGSNDITNISSFSTAAGTLYWSYLAGILSTSGDYEFNVYEGVGIPNENYSFRVLNSINHDQAYEFFQLQQHDGTKILGVSEDGLDLVGTLDTSGLATLQSLALSNVSTTKVLFMFGDDVVGDANFTYNNVTDTLNVPDTVVTGDITVTGTVDGVDVAALKASIKEHTDVNSAMTPTNGQVLTWDGIKWDATTISSGVTDHGALTGLTDDDHTQYLLVNGTRAMTGDLDMGTSEIKLDETKKIIFDSNGTSTQYIQADTFFTIDIFRFRSDAVFDFDITSSQSNGRYDFKLGVDNKNQYLRIRNESNNTLFQFYGDGTSKGLPFTLNGGVDNFVGTRKVAWGESTATGAICIPEKCILQKVCFSINERITTPGDSGVLTLRYRKNPVTGAEATTSIGTFTATTDVFHQIYTMGASHAFNAGDRLEIEVVNTSWSKTSAEGMVALWFTTNE